MTVSPLLTAMTSVTGTVSRFMHIWPYTSLDERARLRAKAVEDGVWPPPGGPSHLVGQRSDVYLPAPFFAAVLTGSLKCLAGGVIGGNNFVEQSRAANKFP